MKRKMSIHADEVEVGMMAHYKGWTTAPQRVAPVSSVVVGEEVRPGVRRVTIWIEGAGGAWVTDSDERVTVVP
jgi:hypothetical protein